MYVTGYVNPNNQISGSGMIYLFSLYIFDYNPTLMYPIYLIIMPEGVKGPSGMINK